MIESGEDLIVAFNLSSLSINALSAFLPSVISLTIAEIPVISPSTFLIGDSVTKISILVPSFFIL